MEFAGAAGSLLEILRAPGRCVAFGPEEWNAALPRLRHARLLGRFAAKLEEAGLVASVPSEARAIFADALVSAEASARALRWEAEEIAPVLNRTGVRWCLIKGGAYAAAGMLLACGRSSADLDVLVEPSRTAEAETALRAAGWAPANPAEDPDEERHARAFLHQAPPLRHPERRTAVDLHHSLSPPRGRLRVDAGAVLDRRRASSWPGVSVPASVDMAIVTAVHLARETELAIALRDVVDFDDLARHLGTASWPALLSRAEALRAAPALAFAAALARDLLGTPCPPPAKERLSATVERLACLAVLPDGVDGPSALTSAARRVMRLRALRIQLPLRTMAARTLSDRVSRLVGVVRRVAERR